MNEFENDKSKEDKKVESEFDVDAVIQERSKDYQKDPYRNKPKLSKSKKKLTVYPVKMEINSEKQDSSLCSIM